MCLLDVSFVSFSLSLGHASGSFSLLFFFLLTSRQFPYTTEMVCTCTLYFLLSVVSICVILRASSHSWACVLGRSNGVSCRDRVWPVGPGFFESLHESINMQIDIV